MTVLVTLAQAACPMRSVDLWKHMQRKYVGCITALDLHGLVCKWAVSPTEVYAALNPAHPAADALRALLLHIARIYEFEPPQHLRSGAVQPVPIRPWLQTNGQFTFGDHIRTFVLLLLHILGAARPYEIVRCLPQIERPTVCQVLWMYTRFGILRHDQAAQPTFSFNPEHVLTQNVREVLARLDQSMPQYRLIAEVQATSVRRPRREVRPTRNPTRWKW